MHLSKGQQLSEAFIGCIVLGFPLFLIIDGSLEFAAGNLNHPDTFILLGLLLLSLVGLVGTIVFGWRWYYYRWQNLPTSSKILTGLYILALLIGTVTWIVLNHNLPLK